jgi:predicted outer membrane repeat protein
MPRSYRRLFLLALVASGMFSAGQTTVVRRVASGRNGTDTPGCGNETHFCNTTQYAISLSSTGDEIHLMKGVHSCRSDHDVYTEDGDFFGIRFLKADKTTANGGIVVRGAPHSTSDEVVYDCKLKSPAFHFGAVEEGNNTILANFTIRNGQAKGRAGGAISVAFFGNRETSFKVHGKGLVIRNVVFRDNVAYGDGGGAVFVYKSKVAFDSCTFYNNRALITDRHACGGAVYLLNSQKIDFSNCAFRNNSASGGGALCLDSSQGTGQNVMVRSCSFENNFTPDEQEGKAGGAVYISGSAGSNKDEAIGKTSFDDCVFKNNYVYRGDGGALAGDIGGQIDINKCTFTNNSVRGTVETHGGAINLFKFAQARFTSSAWSGNSATSTGGALKLHTVLRVLLKNCTYERNSILSSTVSTSGGATVFLKIDQLNITNCTWARNSVSMGGTGGALSFSRCVKINVTDSQWYENSAPQSGGAIYANFQLKLKSAIFTRCKWTKNVANHGGALYGFAHPLDFVRIAFVGCTFRENEGRVDGGAFYGKDVFGVTTFDECKFIKNSALESGGAVQAKEEGSFNPPQSYHFDACYFESNRAKHGGSVRLSFTGEASGASFDSTKFLRNHAFLDGGAIFSSYIPGTDRCNRYLNFTGNNSFVSNAANSSGGAVFIQINDPTKRTNGLTFIPECYRGRTFYSGNAANVGNDLATSKYKLAFYAPDFPDRIALNKEIEGGLMVQDAYGQPCFNAYQSYPPIHLTVNNSKAEFMAVSKLTFPVGSNGIASIHFGNDLRLKRVPTSLVGQRLWFTFSSDGIFSAQTTAVITGCDLGEQMKMVENENLFECPYCSPLQYNVRVGKKCFLCPKYGATCMGKDDIYVKPGYYGNIEDTGEVTVHPCPKGCCCPHTNGTSVESTGRNALGCRVGSGQDCAIGRDPQVPWCGNCKDGLSSLLGTALCAKCSVIGLSGWMWLILPAPAGVLFVFYLLKKNYESPPILFTLGLKNLAFFYQVVGLVLNPSSLVQSIAGPLFVVFNLDPVTETAEFQASKALPEDDSRCLVPGLNPFTKILFGIYPISILLVISWPICMCLFSRNSKLWTNVGPALSATLIMSYSTVCKILTKLVNCRFIGGEYRLFGAGNVRCFSGVSWVWQGFAIFGLLMAAVFLYFLGKAVKKRDAKHHRWLLVMTASYRKEYSWYEAVSMGRRLYLILLASLPLSSDMKMVILAFSLILMRVSQSYLKPFKSKYLNTAEETFLSLLVCITWLSFSNKKNQMDGLLLALVLFPALATVVFSIWYGYARKRPKSGPTDEERQPRNSWEGGANPSGASGTAPAAVELMSSVVTTS